MFGGRRFFCVFALLLFGCLGVLPAVAAGAQLAGVERIIRMDVAVSIEAGGRVKVTEDITFEAAGREIKRGLRRSLPTLWARPDGSRVGLAYSGINVLRDGQSEPVRSEKRGKFLDLFIGKADYLLPRGIYSYQISYYIENAILRKNGTDSLYWNATGNDWAFVIEQASFKLTLPGGPATGHDERIIEKYLYTGRAGTQGEDAKFMADGSARTTAPVAKREGFTVFYSWPTEITAAVPVRELRDGLAYLLLPSFKHLYVFLPSIFLLLLYGFFARRWRDGFKRFQVIPLFDPPAGFLPGDLHFAAKGSYNYKSFASDLLHLIHKRYLFLAEVEGKSVLSRYPKPGDPDSLAGHEPEPQGLGEELPPGGSDFYAKLFAGRSDAVELETDKPQSGTRIVGDVRLGRGDTLADTFTLLNKERRTRRKKLFHPAQQLLVVGIFIWFFAMILIWGNWNSEAALLMVTLTIIVSAPVLLLVLPVWIILSKGDLIEGVAGKLKMYATLFIYVSIGAAILTSMGPALSAFVKELAAGNIWGADSVWGGVLPPGSISALLIGLLGFALAIWKMPRRTADGLALLAQADGVKMYLKTAEEHRFEAIYPPEENLRHFEELLPYALALGVGDTWANSFAAYCTKAGLAELAQREGDFVRGRSDISRSISRSVSSTVSSRSASSSSGGSRSSSSGGRGGGSSGGGAGGGGGGGW